MNKTRSKIFIGIMLLVVFVLGVYNCIKNPEFWTMSMANILTIVVAVIFTYYMTQKTNDIRRKKDIVGKILDRLYVLISDPRMCRINSSEDVDFVKINVRTISNKISCLKEMAKELQYEEEVRQMEETFSLYEDFISDHIDDLPYLEKSGRELNNKIALLDNKCDMILVKINS